MALLALLRRQLVAVVVTGGGRPEAPEAGRGEDDIDRLRLCDRSQRRLQRIGAGVGVDRVVDAGARDRDVLAQSLLRRLGHRRDVEALRRDGVGGEHGDAATTTDESDAGAGHPSRARGHRDEEVVQFVHRLGAHRAGLAAECLEDVA